MKAVVLDHIGPIESRPLKTTELSMPSFGNDEVLLKVLTCGACHTDLDEIEGRLTPASLPRVLGHQVVGEIVDCGCDVSILKKGQRIGVTWLGRSCGKCGFCMSSRENLCENALWTGLDIDGGYAEYMTIDEQFAYPIPEVFDNFQAAPLLCAGIIGYRAVRLAQIIESDTVGLFGFGASAHIVIQILKYKFPESNIFVFTRSKEHKQMAKKLGADWIGGLSDEPPEKIDKAIDFTPVGETVLSALKVCQRGAKVVINAIRKQTPVPSIDYAEYLWHERQIQSVANVTRKDAKEFLELAASIQIKPQAELFELEQANDVLIRLKQGKVQGAAVFQISK